MQTFENIKKIEKENYRDEQNSVAKKSTSHEKQREEKKNRSLQKRGGARRYTLYNRTSCNNFTHDLQQLSLLDACRYSLLWRIGGSLLIELYVAVGELELERALLVLAQQRRSASPRPTARGKSRAPSESPLYLRRRQITVLVYPMPQTHQPRTRE